MDQIGIRELRDRASEILRRVREDKTQYVVTFQGRPMALIVPIDQQALSEHLEAEGQKALENETLTSQLYGLVHKTLSDEQLEEQYLEE